MIPPRDIDVQRILQSDWTRDTPDHTQPKVVRSDATFHDDYLRAKILKNRLIPPGDIDDQRILQSD